MKQQNNMVTGLALGALLGAAAGVVGHELMTGNKKKMRKKAAKAMKTVNGMVSDLSSMIRS